MEKVNRFINRYFGLILLASAISGLFLNIPVKNLSLYIILALGGIIFSSFFRIDLNKQLFTEDIRDTTFYLFIRFILFPAAVFPLINPVSPFYAVIFFLLLVLPAAVSSPAFTAMYGGKISLSLKVLVLTSFLSILTIPGLSSLLLSQKIEINTGRMFLTMVYTIVVPFVLHLPFRKNKNIRPVFVNNNPLITAIGLMVIFILATSNNRDIILSDPAKVFLYAVVSFVIFIILYFIGFYLVFKQPKQKSIAYSVASGANNIGIGVTITAIYFPGDVNVFMIVAQITWIFALIPMRVFFRKI